MSIDQISNRHDRILDGGNHSTSQLARNIYDKANRGDWQHAFDGNDTSSQFLQPMTLEHSSGAPTRTDEHESSPQQGSGLSQNFLAGLSSSGEVGTSPSNVTTATSTDAQSMAPQAQLQQIENELQTVSQEISNLAAELGLATPAQASPGSDVTPTAPAQASPGSDVTPTAPVQASPGSDVTPTAPVQAPPGSDVTPTAPVQAPPGSDVTPTAPAQGDPGSDVTPTAPAQTSQGSDVTPTAPAQASPGSDVTPNNGAPVSASSLSTNPADYGATQQINFNPATMVNVENYGAVGNGQTDDTAAFNAALTAASAEGKSVYVPNGTYDHDGQISVTGSGGLIGQSSSAVLMATDTAHGGASGDAAEAAGYSNRAIDITGNGATVENLTLTANSTIPRYGGMEAIAVNIQGSNDTVNGVTVDGGTASQSNFTNGVVVNALNGNLSNETITNNLVENTNSDYIRIAAWNNNGVNNDVSNVLVQGNMALSTAGAALGDDSYSAIGNNGATITNYDAINNVAIGPKQWGNDFDMEGVEGKSEIVANYIDAQGAGKSAGVVVQVPPTYPGVATNGLAIADNYFDGDGSTNSNFGAVALWNGADNISIANNTFTNSVGPDISATGSGDSAVQTGNKDTDGNLTTNDKEGALKG
jgi:hypothetical protein